MPDLPQPPEVRLGATADGSIAPSVLAIVHRAVLLRPQRALALEARVVLRFDQGFPPVRVHFAGAYGVLVEDVTEDVTVDLAITGALPDVVALLAAPLGAGRLPSPAHPDGRAALASLLQGRVALEGPLTLGLEVLRLLTVADDRRARRRLRRPAAAA